MFEVDITPIVTEDTVLDIDSWIFNYTHRSKNRMKITLKLDQEQSDAYLTFMRGTKPDEISEDDFLKSIFFLGLGTLEQNIVSKLSESMDLKDGEVSFDTSALEDLDDDE
jgi:hypothetical protein|tara:strand:+ start:141 stop:470 length:330 start_codon:yes stop_codon:yes gene_type:complete